MGGAAWLATCRRLKLPEPPVDPSGPSLYTEWKRVAVFDDPPGGGDKARLLHYSDGVAYVHDPRAMRVVGYAANGSCDFEVPLS